MWFKHWARKRHGDWQLCRHADWTFRIHQFAYRHMFSGVSIEYRIMVRAKKGWFGATRWTYLDTARTQDECCNKIRAMVEDYDESAMKDMLDTQAEVGRNKANANKLIAYCGYSVDGILK